MYEHFLKEIIFWYQNNKRDLPWRNTDDAYLIWLSEIILQQTRVNQGMPYYLKFSELYPDVVSFANAPIDDILRTWQGLGYYSRARNMHQTAQAIRDKYKGIFPTLHKDLIQLKGIGSYTAAAISSFAANEQKAVVDGNVYRVLSRYWGIEEPINSSKGPKIYSDLAQNIIQNTTQHGLYNQAIMEFGAIQCKPVSPNCKVCPLESSCTALQSNLVHVLPIKINKLKVRERSIHYLVLEQGGLIYMKKRGDGDIWNGLYDFIEISEDNIPKELMYSSKTYIHKLTHQKLQIRFHVTHRVPSSILLNPDGFYSLQACENLPKPIIIKQFIDELKNILG